MLILISISLEKNKSNLLLSSKLLFEKQKTNASVKHSVFAKQTVLFLNNVILNNFHKHSHWEDIPLWSHDKACTPPKDKISNSSPLTALHVHAYALSKNILHATTFALQTLFAQCLTYISSFYLMMNSVLIQLPFQNKQVF